MLNWSPVQFSSGHFVSVHLILAHCSHKKCVWWLHAEIFTSVPACAQSWAIAIFEVRDCDERGRCYWGGCFTVIRFPVAVTLLTSLHRYHISLWWLRCGHSWMVLCGMWVINHLCSSFSHLLNFFSLVILIIYEAFECIIGAWRRFTMSVSQRYVMSFQ